MRCFGPDLILFITASDFAAREPGRNAMKKIRANRRLGAKCIASLTSFLTFLLSPSWRKITALILCQSAMYPFNPGIVAELA